jgi:hypothetical protein
MMMRVSAFPAMGPLTAPIGFERQSALLVLADCSGISRAISYLSDMVKKSALYSALGEIFKRSATSSTVRRERHQGHPILGNFLYGYLIGHCVLFVNKERDFLSLS